MIQNKSAFYEFLIEFLSIEILIIKKFLIFLVKEVIIFLENHSILADKIIRYPKK
tara:strand:+ start:1337 stop:1501 length:165 start_codon:yes stop_codon:yes gene_type:complete